MFYQQGGINKVNVSQQAQLFVNQHTQQINQIFGVHYNGFMVVEEHAQILGSNGSNHILQIVGQPNNGGHYTITVHVPNNGLPIIIESRPGIINNYQHGYGQQYGKIFTIQATKDSYTIKASTKDLIIAKASTIVRALIMIIMGIMGITGIMDTTMGTTGITDTMATIIDN